jgi:NDP-sugar pyrophosphorylase family protein
MRSELAPEAFLELGSFRHAALFAGAAWVWEALARLEAYLASLPDPKLEGRVSPSAWIEGRVAIGAGSVVEPGAYIQGPCVIGRDTEVRHAAYIRGPALIGDGCVVGHATEVKGSIFLDRAKAGHFAYVGDSILGREVNLGAGTKLANLRLDGKEVVVRVGGRAVPTGRRKLGAVLGDRVETGCNSVTNPGTFLGPGARLYPCVAASGFHPARSVVVGRGGRGSPSD